MKRLFDKLSGREQTLFLLLIWSGILYWGSASLGQMITQYQAYDGNATAILNHNKVLKGRGAIETEIEKKLTDKGISGQILKNSAYSNAKSVHSNVWPKKARGRKDFETVNLGEYYEKNTVEIEFRKATWKHLENYVNEIKNEKHMFLSKVQIDPNYFKEGPVKDYTGNFWVSALWKKKARRPR